jgi:hypothetical protein
MSQAPDDELRTGTAGRVALVLGALTLVGALAWWLWPAQSGEVELAHRVLIVGGTATDLVTPIAEAGFEAEQRTWADTETDVRELTGSFDRDALLDYADEHGYGFVAVMLGNDDPWTGVELDSEAPSEADAAVLCVGELCLDGQPRVHFGALPPGFEYAPALRRSEALRLALYEHPDLLRLWEQPTPEQMQQQLQLGKLADARTRLASMLVRYREGASAWPKQWPKDAITQPWTHVHGFPVPGGLALQRTPLQLAVDERRKVEVVEREREVVFVPIPTRNGDPFANAKPITLPLLGNGVLSNNLRWLVAEDVERGAVHRWELGPGTLHDRGPIEHDDFRRADRWDRAELSDTGTLAWATLEGVSSELGALRLQDLQPIDFCWHDAQTLALALFDESEGLDHALSSLLLARPNTDTPELLALSLADVLGDHGGYVEPLSVHPTSSAGTYVVVRHQTPEGLAVESLIRIALPSPALSVPSAVASTIDPASLRAVLRPIAALREHSGAAIESLGIIPPFEQLDIAPDGSWVAWRMIGERGSIYAARIDEGRLGATIQLAQRSPPALEWHQRPRFLADSSALVLPAEQPWPFGAAVFVRVVARIEP